MNEKIKELIEKRAELRAKYKLLQEQSDKSEDLAEVRAIGETLKTLRDEISSVEEELKAAEEEEGEGNGEGEGEEGNAGEEGRGFNPMATYSIRNGADGEMLERRAKAFVETGRLNIEAGEARAVLVSSGSIATPKGVAGITDSHNVISSIVDQVNVEDCTGMGEYHVGYEKEMTEANMGTEGVAAAENGPAFRIAAIRPFLVNTIAYVSRGIKKQSPLTYTEKVQAAALSALRKKVANLILTGNGTNQPYGIMNAQNTEIVPENIYETTEIGTIDENTLRNIVFAYGGDENVGANACLYLNKNDLIAFGDVRGTNEKAAVYEIIPDGSNPNTGIIKDGGLSVPYCINSSLAVHATAEAGTKTMAYGDPMNYTCGLFGDYEVRVSEDYKFAEGMLAVMGEVYVGGNVTKDKGFVVVTKTA